MCDKESFINKTAATLAARAIASRCHQSMHSYYCDECGMFHLSTNKSAKKLLPQKNNKYPFRLQDFIKQ